MSTQFREPSVELLASFNQKMEAWKIARPYLTEDVKIEEIEQMDLPLNGMASYVLKYTCSLLFRDLLFTLRPIVPWARSLRTVKFDESNLFLSGEYEGINDDLLQDKMSKVYANLESGMQQDYAKKLLPMATSTEFTVNIDDRTLIAFLKLLKEHNTDLYQVYGLPTLEAIGKDDDYVEARRMVDIYPKLALSEQERKDVGIIQTCGEMIYGVFELSNNLMAQFIRQHYSTVKNSLMNTINNASLSELIYINCDSESIVALYADKNSFKKVISARSCWCAQLDQENNESWSSIIGPYVEDITPKNFLGVLPCHGDKDKCTVKKDMEARTRRLEHNPPCPIITSDPSLVDFRKREFDSDSRVFEKWEALVDEGMIKDDPNDPDRRIYESSSK